MPGCRLIQPLHVRTAVTRQRKRCRPMPANSSTNAKAVAPSSSHCQALAACFARMGLFHARPSRSTRRHAAQREAASTRKVSRVHRLHSVKRSALACAKACRRSGTSPSGDCRPRSSTCARRARQSRSSLFRSGMNPRRRSAGRSSANLACPRPGGERCTRRSDEGAVIFRAVRP